jgi:hypothetical protein
MLSGKGRTGRLEEFTGLLMSDAFDRLKDTREGLKLGRKRVAESPGDSTFGSVVELQQFGRQLLAAKKPQAALEIFQFNYNKNPNQFITLTRVARGLFANREDD